MNMDEMIRSIEEQIGASLEALIVTRASIIDGGPREASYHAATIHRLTQALRELRLARYDMDRAALEMQPLTKL